jgi:hypothetical protein
MRIDAQNEFSDAQAVTVTALSTNVIDLGQVQPKIMGGEDLYVEVNVGTTFAGGTSLRAVLWTDNTTTATSGADIISGDVLTVASNLLDAGVTVLRVSLKGLDLQRYIVLQYVVVGTMSAGTLDAALVITPDTDGMTLA